jgi:RNA polymerase sigma-70 factor (ECF subfamily)
MDDASLVERAQDGDREAFALIVEKYQNHIFNIVNNIVNDRDVAFDITQETFFKLYNNIETVDTSKPLFPYLVRIATNTSKDYMRAHVRRKALNEHLKIRKTVEKNADNVERLYEIVYKLDKEEREIFLLRYRDGKSLKEIALLMNMSISNAKVKLFRVRKKVFEMWKKE